MTSIFKTVLASALLCAAATVHCQELKIGVVNLERVLRDAAPAKAAQAKLEGEFTRREKDLADSEARLKSSSDRFEKYAPALCESERARRQRDLK